MVLHLLGYICYILNVFGKTLHINESTNEFTTFSALTHDFRFGGNSGVNVVKSLQNPVKLAGSIPKNIYLICGLSILNHRDTDQDQVNGDEWVNK